MKNQYMDSDMNTRRFLLVLPSFEVGGAELQAIKFADYLQETGREVSVVSFGKEGEICRICEKKRIPWMLIDKPPSGLFFIVRLLRKVYMLPPYISPFFETLAFPLIRLIKQGGFEVCIAYCYASCLWLGAASRYYKKAYLIWYQRDAGIDSIGNIYEKKMLNIYDKILANSTSGKEYLRKQFGINAQIIHNGVVIENKTKDVTEWRKRIKSDNGVIICTMVANLHKAKDHETILKIWREIGIRKKINMPKLVLAGRFDDNYEHLKRYVKDNSLSDWVEFLGPIDDIPGLLSVTDICVFGAKSEGSPNGIIEATMMALPIVATNLPEIQEVVSEENLPYLFNANDIVSAAIIIEKLVDNPELRKRIGERNEARSRIFFNREKNFHELVALAEEGFKEKYII